jgi:CPA1 family monovalent cation:H+ antiporter
MVVAGLGLALVPGLPRLDLAPELVLFGILPPLIYMAGVSMSWREFRYNLRAIILFAFGGVIFTACAIAAAVHWLLGMPPAVALVLGAIVAPPDVVAPLAIARRLGIPRRLLVVLEGETRWLSPSLARRDPAPPWEWSFILAFVGVRGVVSLAAALAIPLTTASGTPFPYRNLILAVTFGVIIITLIGKGALLPAVVRWLGLADHTAAERQREHEAETRARWKALDAAQHRLGELEAEGRIPAQILNALRHRHASRSGRLQSRRHIEGLSISADVRTELIRIERALICKLLRDGDLTDESRRRIERELDLEEASIACKKEAGTD